MINALNKKRLQYFLPGVAMLVLSMVALHVAVADNEQHTQLLAYYNANQAATDVGIIKAMMVGKQVYWSIIAMGLFGFVLVLLNANKLVQLEAINEEKRSDLALLNQRLAAMEATLDGIALIDEHEHITYLNASFRHMYGITSANQSEYIGHSWQVFFPECEHERIETEVLPSVDAIGAWRGVFDRENIKGEISNLELEFARIDDGGMICTVRNITQQIKDDADKKDMQSQLYQAQKMEAIGRLAGGIAHDFNNILAAMNGYAEFLIEDLKAGSSEHKFAQNILQAGHQAKALVDQMLAFSRHKNSEFKVMDLLKPMDESLSMLRASLPKTIEVKTDFAVKEAPIEGNETQIAQIIMNLCVNAKDAMDNNKGILSLSVNRADMETEQAYGWLTDKAIETTDTPTISIETKGRGQTALLLGKLARGREYIRMAVSDTGTGMPREVMDVIFEPFFTTKPIDKGTGLGLATAHGVVAGHGGAMRIKSTIGVGTVFELFFPLVAVQDLEQTPEDINIPESGSGNILLVEDQEEVRQMTLKMLERLGYEADAVDNGEVALEVLREMPDQYDLVLTDQSMPKMTGLELAEQLYKEQPDMPFILLSGYSEEKLQRLIKEHPAIKLKLRKPIKKDELGKHIAHVLSVHGKNKTRAA